MSLLIKNWSITDWKELLKWAKIGANNAMIGEFAEVEELPSHGKLINVDTLTISTAVPLDGKSYQYVHIDNIKSAPSIIPASEEGKR